jgi:hypothetical protein
MIREQQCHHCITGKSLILRNPTSIFFSTEMLAEEVDRVKRSEVISYALPV